MTRIIEEEEMTFRDADQSRLHNLNGQHESVVESKYTVDNLDVTVTKHIHHKHNNILVSEAETVTTTAPTAAPTTTRPVSFLSQEPEYLTPES